jgi:hypothetical protein
MLLTGIGLDPNLPKFWQLIVSSAKLSAITHSSNLKLDNVELLNSPDGYKPWSQKISVICDAMGIYTIVVSGIDPSPLAYAVNLITLPA